MTRHGWMVVYHGVHELADPSTTGHKLCYSAGVLVLPRKHPRHIRYRSPEPVLTPDLPRERIGTVANVVFPTAIDRRDDRASRDRWPVDGRGKHDVGNGPHAFLRQFRRQPGSGER